MSRAEEGGVRPTRSRRAIGRLIGAAALVVAGFVVVAILPPWVLAWLGREGVDRLIRRTNIGFLRALRIAYLAAVVAAPVASILLTRRITTTRRRGEASARAARMLLLSLSVLAGLVCLEGAAATWSAWVHGMPTLPTRFPEEERPRDGRPADDEVFIVVIGESSARGEPFDPRASIAQMAAWQLEEAFPGRRFRVEMRAEGGSTLERAIGKLSTLTRRPDAILVCSGHNEFQARYGWSRATRHYIEEDPFPPPGAVAEWAARVSPLCALIAETIEVQGVGLAPPPVATRELVDHPSTTPTERGVLREDFRRRLEGLALYCERIGALPIFVIPASNDGDFAPNRSYLAPSTRKADREAFAREFQAVRALEDADPGRAEDLYRGQLARQPDFAEAHFRLATLLERRGSRDEAALHFIRARDLDGLPLRCPSPFEDAYREVAARHRVILVDGPALFRRLSPTGIADDLLLIDAHHPTFRGYVAMAQDLVGQLCSAGALGLPAATDAPTIDPAACAEGLGMARQAWIEACERSGKFYHSTAYVRYDPSESLDRARRYWEAARLLAEGREPEEVGIPGLGLQPKGLPDAPDRPRRAGLATRP